MRPVTAELLESGSLAAKEAAFVPVQRAVARNYGRVPVIGLRSIETIGSAAANGKSRGADSLVLLAIEGSQEVTPQRIVEIGAFPDLHAH